MKKHFVSTALLAACLAWIAASPALSDKISNDHQAITQGKLVNGVRHVNASEAHSILQHNKSIVVIDVRTAKEFETFHIKDAQNIDYYSSDFKQLVAQLDPDKTYLVHCKSGYRSGKSVSIMQSTGIKSIIHLDGGMNAWLKGEYDSHQDSQSEQSL